MAMAALLLVPGVAAAGQLRQAYSVDQMRCLSAIERTERTARLPPKLLGAIGMVESGRVDPVTQSAAPWPWSINVAGVDHVFSSKREAIAAVEAARAAGVQSIDVGCMQVNLMHHPDAFANLDEAFDPDANVTYAAGFLWRLHGDLGTWPAAAAAYHSMTPSLGNAYVARVAVFWSPAAGYVVPGADPSPAAVLPQVDPYNVMTPELKARLLQDAKDREMLVARFKPAPPRRPGSILSRQTGIIARTSGRGSLMPVRTAFDEPVARRGAVKMASAAPRKWR